MNLNRRRADRALDEIMAPPRRKAAPPPVSKKVAALAWGLMALARLLAWDYSRRDRVCKWIQVRNLKARNRVINTLADVTGEKQLKIL